MGIHQQKQTCKLGWTRQWWWWLIYCEERVVQCHLGWISCHLQEAKAGLHQEEKAQARGCHHQTAPTERACWRLRLEKLPQDRLLPQSLLLGINLIVGSKDRFLTPLKVHAPFQTGVHV